MTFLQLYGEQLHHELGSQDTTELFTTARRKDAINRAQDRFVLQTKCTERLGTISLVDGTGEYDVEALLTDWIMPLGDPSIKIVESGVTDRYIEGQDLARMDPPKLNIHEPGWRATSAQTPFRYYWRREGGRDFLGFYPPLDLTATQTGSALVPYLADPSDLSLDADEPFTVSSNVVITMRPYHQALVHYAASRLELLRKNYTRSKEQLQFYSGFVAEYMAKESEQQEQTIWFARDYLQEASRSPRPLDPRRYP